MLNDPSMRMLLHPILAGLPSSLTISPATVAAQIKLQAAELRQALKDHLGKRLICIKGDGAKRLDRAIVGIQFIEDGKIQLRNLAAIKLKDRRTSSALKKKRKRHSTTTVFQ